MGDVALSDDDMWHFLAVVVTDEEGGRSTVGIDPKPGVVDAERAGYIWLRRCLSGYIVEVTPLGRQAAHRWAARHAKVAAREFGKVE